MARPRKGERSIRQEIYFPESLHSRIAMILFSPAEGRVPHGAWTEFVVALVRDRLGNLPSSPKGAPDGPLS